MTVDKQATLIATMENFQESVGQWADTTFPQSSWQSIASHLQEETQELENALYTAPREGRGQFGEEAADCFLLLLHLAHKEGFSLIGEVITKDAANRQRTWETDDQGRGYWKHIEAVS
jgi:NTP pyrophosphatase (non-canonical NTP hydrolase)